MVFKTTRGLTESKLKDEHPSYYEGMDKFIKEDDELTLSEKIWLYQNGFSEKPKCLNCDNKVSFIKFYKGYRKYCSKKCSAQHTHKNSDVKKSRLAEIRKCNADKEIRSDMTRKANLTKSRFSDKKKKDINIKRENTIKESWGVDNISKVQKTKDKISKKLKEVLPSIKLEKTKKRITDLGYVVISIKNNSFKLICPKCKKEFNISSTLFNQRNRFDIDPCLLCNPNNNGSFFESSVFDFVKNNYNGVIKDKCREFKKYEIDIYLPELNIGFECNGLWWHSERYKENNYHKEKNKFFESKGIQIIHIWEDDWKFKKDILKSRIVNLLGNSTRKIWGRKCKIKELTPSVYKEFVDKNHLQGYVPSKYKIGLYFGNELVSVISFSKTRRNLGYKNTDEDVFELLRFCSKLNTNVVGGSSKLLKYFIKTYKSSRIISYASKDWSTGNLYEKIGFNKVKETVPNYFYFHKDEGLRINRFNFRKDVLVKEGYDKNKSEHQIMNDRGYYRVYDTGSLLFEMNI